MAVRLLSAALLATLALGGSATPARDQAAEAQLGPPPEECDTSVYGEEVCLLLEALTVGLSSVCEELVVLDDVCALVEGNIADPALVDSYERTWTSRALRLQNHLDDDEPLRNALVPHTHNSFNSTVYPLSVSNLDPNQRYSLGDQLRMGVRGIELDLHWVISPFGSLDTGGRAVTLCHGQSVELLPDTFLHVGCSLDRPLEAGLQELRAWLDAPGNEDEFLLLYLQNELEASPQAHDLAAAAIEDVLGDLVIRPPAGEPCADMPLDTSQDDLVAAHGGARVLIVGNCGPGAWGTLVHERGPRWMEASSTDVYPAFPDCIARRDAEDYDANWIRTWEDETFLSEATGGGAPVTPDEVAAMVRCGLDMPGFDLLTPLDPRLEALIWSWARNEPRDENGACAVRGTDGRFRASDCDEQRAFTCRNADGSWLVTEATGVWAMGDAACRAVGATFAVPPTGWEDERVGAVLVGADAFHAEPWLAYARIGDEWTPGAVAFPGAPVPAPTASAPKNGSMPATGGASPLPLLLAAVALAGALVLRYQCSPRKSVANTICSTVGFCSSSRCPEPLARDDVGKSL